MKDNSLFGFRVTITLKGRSRRRDRKGFFGCARGYTAPELLSAIHQGQHANIIACMDPFFFGMHGTRAPLARTSNMSFGPRASVLQLSTSGRRLNPPLD